MSWWPRLEVVKPKWSSEVAKRSRPIMASGAAREAPSCRFMTYDGRAASYRAIISAFGCSPYAKKAQTGYVNDKGCTDNVGAARALACRSSPS